MGEYFSLDEICSKYNFLFVDTCSFEASFFDAFNNKTSPDEKLTKMMLSNASFSFWIDKIPVYKNIHATDGIVDEIRNCRYKYKKSIKKPVYRREDNETVVQLRRELKFNKQNKLNLANLLEFEGRIFKMNENQEKTYDDFYKKYSFLADKFNLSNVDFDLLISGAVISRENNTSIISNDFGIRQAWRSFLKREPSSGRDFSFYSGCMINFFKQEELK